MIECREEFRGEDEENRRDDVWGGFVDVREEVWEERVCGGERVVKKGCELV